MSGAPGDPGGASGRRDRPPQAADPVHEQGAHVGRCLGVRMKLHSEPPVGRNGSFGNAHSF